MELRRQKAHLFEQGYSHGQYDCTAPRPSLSWPALVRLRSVSGFMRCVSLRQPILAGRRVKRRQVSAGKRYRLRLPCSVSRPPFRRLQVQLFQVYPRYSLYPPSLQTSRIRCRVSTPPHQRWDMRRCIIHPARRRRQPLQCRRPQSPVPRSRRGEIPRPSLPGRHPYLRRVAVQRLMCRRSSLQHQRPRL